MEWKFSLTVYVLAGFLSWSNGQQEGGEPPSWDEAAVNAFLSDVSEATQVGDVLGYLSCTDPEGDPILYAKETGSAVVVSSDGEVRLDIPIDFEALDAISYQVSVSCVDVCGEPIPYACREPIKYNTIISPTDANDNPPTFSIEGNEEGYSLRISELASVGTVLTPQISITDLDRGLNAVLDELFLICNSPYIDRDTLAESSIATCEKFVLTYQQTGEGRYTADITLNATVDFEKRDVYSSKLVAIDGGTGVTPKQTTTVNIQILIQDAQDIDPYFVNLGASVTISEDLPAGTSITDFGIQARDGDTDAWRDVVIDIIRDVEDAFEIGPSVQISDDGVFSAELILKNPLDREIIGSTYDITAMVTELDEFGNRTDSTATANYTVFVSDANDNGPVFSQDIYYVNVTEMTEMTINEVVQISGFRIDCNDPDEPTSAQYVVTVIEQTFNTYSVTPGTEFTGQASMFLQLGDGKYLDYDTPEYREQEVVLKATETGPNIKTPAMSASTTIKISLIDINDNSPVFEKSDGYVTGVSESVSIFPHDVIQLSASDADSGLNGEVRYSLEGEDSLLFTIDEVSGQILLNEAVDFEANAQYAFFAYASDLAEVPRETQVLVTVNIENYNDQAPSFLLPVYQTSVEESSTTFFNPVNITAVDTEDGTTKITYRIVESNIPNNALVINANTGDLSLSDLLNYEDTPIGSDGQYTGEFQVIVEASDNGSPPQTSNVTVVITVFDVNDHTPVVTPKEYETELSELAAPGTLIVQITATDEDSGEFGKITFRIGKGLSDNFYIDPDTGNLTVGDNRVFNYDVESYYELEIIASDGGSPQESATATVKITITDGNNQSPTFSSLLYSITVDETEPVNKVVRNIAAGDLDGTANLEYSIITSTIRASDPDGRTLDDTSDYDYKNAFGVNNNGDIYIKNKLERDDASQISFTLQVEDVNTKEGIPTATTQVTIIITGEANTNITFDEIFTVYMNENAEEEYSAITVTARDPNNNAVPYYEKIDQAGTSDNFEVQSNGQIVLITPVDYENDPQINHLHLVVVRALSSDRTQKATATATISVVDVNDNQPVFVPALYDVDLPETTAYPMEVATLYAEDADSSSFGPLEFSISGGLNSEDFEIFNDEASTGSRTSRKAYVIVSKGTVLDYNRRSEYNLDITVEDNVNTEFSSAQLRSNAKLTIRIIDENNNSPEFAERERTLSVPETASLSQSIATIIATDKDIGDNGDITYTLEATAQSNSASGLQLFSISSSSGIVRVQDSLLGLGGKIYEMRVRATDNGEVPNSSYMDLTITVQSIEDDDGNPQWVSPASGYVVQAPEETPGYVLADASGDTTFFDVIPRTGQGIQYSLSDAGQYAGSFSINATTGEITIIDYLDREIEEFYELLVYAEDTSDPNNVRSGRQLIVQLIDQNDNSPSFNNPDNYVSCGTIDNVVTFYVNENIAANISVAQLSACDPDADEAASLYYELYDDQEYCREGNLASILRLDGSTGQLITNEAVDYEQGQEYLMCVRVMPVNTPTALSRKKRAFDLTQVNEILDDVAYITIVIVDENDNGPRFPDPQPVAVVRTQPDSGPVITLTATDPDGPDNNIVSYRVSSSNFVPESGLEQAANDVFSLRGDSGALYPALASYQQFIGGRFVLTVQAIDKNDASFTDEATVTIYVYVDGDAIKIIIDDEPASAIGYSSNLIEELDAVSNSYSFSFLQVSEHTTDDDIDPEKTDVCFLVVDEVESSVLDIRQVISLLDEDGYNAVVSKEEYNQLDRGRCFPSQSSEDDIRWRDLWWMLVAVAIFIFVCCIILIILVVLLYQKYKRYMETKQLYLVSQ